MQGQGRLRVLTVLGVFGVLTLFMIPFTVIAQTAPPNNVGGSTIYVFCLDFGKNFPQGRTIMAQGLADDRVRGALSYALSKGYVTSDPYQVQLAIWNLRDGQPFHDINNRGTVRAQEIVMNAGTVPAGNAGDVGNLSVSNITPADANDAYGTGTVSGMLPPNAPIGFVLPAPDTSFQGLVSVVASPTPAATNTPAAAAAATNTPVPSPAPTNTPAPTMAPTGTRTSSPAPTNTPAATATCAPGTAPTTTGSGATATAPVGTRAATTASGAATSAAGATPTCAPTPVATGTGGGTTPTTLPTTGAPRDPNSMSSALILTLVAAFLVTGSGMALRRRAH